MSQDYEVKQKQFFAKLLAEPTNNLCADCGSKSPRWASWNLGSFICIRCSGIHRKLGVHITKVKSVTLDKWTDEQLLSMTNGGNAKVNQLYNPSNVQLDPSALGSGSDADRKLEQFIRDKYEFKRYMNGSVPSYGQPQQTQQRSSPTSNQSFAYNNELKQLVGMGFEENLVREALQSSRGSVPSAVEYIVAHRRPSTTTIQPSNNSNNTGTPREYFKDAPRTLTKEVSSTGQVLNQGTSPLIKQLHNMGFTDDAMNMAAINQANGSLELAVEMLAEGKIKPSKQPQVQHQKAAPKQDLVGLFDAPEQQNNNDFGDFQNSAPAQSQISSNASKKMNANDILGLFDSAPMQSQQPIQQQYQQSPPIQQQQFQQNYQQPAQNYGQQQFQQSPPQQQFGQFQQQPQRVVSPPQSQVSDSNPFGAPQQQFGQFQQSPPQQQFGQFQQSPPQQQFPQQAQFGQFQQSPPPRQQMPQPTGNPFANSPPTSQISSNYTVQVF